MPGRAVGRARGEGIAVAIATTSNAADRNASTVECQRNLGAVHQGGSHHEDLS